MYVDGTTLKIYKVSDFSAINEKWNGFTDSEKEFVIEFLKAREPHKAQLLKEYKWYNTLGDIVGIFDPTGVVDIVNGVSYITQGDYLFGTLSLVSAVPYLGDLIGKPLMWAARIGGRTTRLINGAGKLAKMGKTAEAAAKLEKIAVGGGLLGGFVKGASSWSPKVVKFLDKLPLGIFNGLKNTITDWFKLLGQVGTKSTAVKSAASALAKAKTISAAEQLKNIGELKTLMKTPIFKNAGLSSATGLGAIFINMMPKFFVNKQLQILAVKTKFWLGFLDFVGVGNFVGPEELQKQVGPGVNLQEKMNEYIKTPEAKQYAEEDFPETSNSETETPQKDVEKKGEENKSSVNFLDSMNWEDLFNQ